MHYNIKIKKIKTQFIRKRAKNEHVDSVYKKTLPVKYYMKIFLENLNKNDKKRKVK